jgi:AhpD family alkylhydroperoxidase
MDRRIDYQSSVPEALRAMYGIEGYLSKTTLEPIVRIFVSIRASQINGCAFCLAMHWREAENLGERGDRLHGLPAWREAPWYTPRERAALEWTEALTQIAGKQISDDLFARIREHFDEKEVVALTMAVNQINAWNRLNIAFRTPPELAEAVVAHQREPVAS